MQNPVIVFPELTACLTVSASEHSVCFYKHSHPWARVKVSCSTHLSQRGTFARGHSEVALVKSNPFYVICPSPNCHMLGFHSCCSIFHLLIFPISSHSLERYCVSFTITMMRAPPVSIHEGHSNEWTTTLWSYSRVRITVSCRSLGS